MVKTNKPTGTLLKWIMNVLRIVLASSENSLQKMLVIT